MTAIGIGGWLLGGLLAAALLVNGSAGSPEKADDSAPKPARPSKETPMLTWQTLNIEEKSPAREDKVVHTDEEWRKRLTPDQYKILRSHGTDPAFCGILEDNKELGVYHCAGCDLPLFVSDHKFNSGTGWPSFYLPVERKNVWFRTDLSYGMRRVEVLCARCDGHLGHVFPDGPAPSRLRFCINGNAMKFKKNEPK